MQPRQILETALYVRDVEEAVRFYRDTLGMKLVHPNSARSAFFHCGNGVLILFNAELTRLSHEGDPLPVPTHGASGEGHTCFTATHDEMDDWRKHLEKRGVAIEADFEWPNGARSIYFRDPSGNSLEFAEPKLWGKA